MNKISGGLKYHILLIVFLYIGIGNICAQLQVIHSSKIPENSNRDGLFYTLPRTILIVEVEVEKTSHFKGPFSEMAGKYLSLNSVVDSDRIQYKISNVEIREQSEPDPEQVYFIQFPDRLAKESWNLNVLMLPENSLSEINLIDKEEKSTESQIKIIDSIVKIRTSDRNGSEFLQIVSDGVKTREEIAREYVLQIKQIRDNKLKLLSGFQEIGYSKESIQFMVQELEKLENEYLDLFRGKLVSEKETIVYKYIPESFKEGEEVPLFKFSQTLGCLELRNPNPGDNVFIEVVRNGFTFGTSKLKTINPDGSDIASGLYFRMPELADIKMYMNGFELVSKKSTISQFGIIRLLPPGKFNAKLDPKTGAMQSLIFK